jgi:hypothetical protein
MNDTTGVVTLDEDDGLLLIGVNRPEAHNLWNLEVIRLSCERIDASGMRNTCGSACSTPTGATSPQDST